jgi:hypothetical protein
VLLNDNSNNKQQVLLSNNNEQQGQQTVVPEVDYSKIPKNFKSKIEYLGRNKCLIEALTRSY